MGGFYKGSGLACEGLSPTGLHLIVLMHVVQYYYNRHSMIGHLAHLCSYMNFIK